jgi:peptide/nickel transport system substrate-binding protein
MNAGFVIIDNQMQRRGELAERLPELNTDTWKVSPDGTMETTFTLRSGLTWHDGQPLTAEDFVFSWRAYRTPSLPFEQAPQNFIDQVTAPDPRTVVIKWNTPTVEAGVLGATNFAPLPAHILGERFQAVERDASAADGFANAAFWSSEFIGSGPYRLERWEPGAFIEGSAFDGYALGRPKIDRIVVRFMGDENTVLTNVLAGELDYAPTLVMRFEHLEPLKRDWVASGKGNAVVGPDYFIMIQFQFRPEFQNEPALFDVRTRRALSHALDRQLLADAIFGGETEIAYTWAWKFTPYFAEADRTITKHPYDQRLAEQLLTEAGLRKGADGFYAYADGKRFQPDYEVSQSTERERGQAITVDMWKQVGVDAQPSLLPSGTVPEMRRHTWPNINGRTGAPENWTNWPTELIGGPANRWTGQNRSGWSNAEFDRLYDAYRRTLDRREMDRISVQILKLLSDEVPGFVQYDAPAMMAHVTALRGPTFPYPGTPGPMWNWNLHEWEMGR